MTGAFRGRPYSRANKNDRHHGALEVRRPDHVVAPLTNGIAFDVPACSRREAKRRAGGDRPSNGVMREVAGVICTSIGCFRRRHIDHVPVTHTSVNRRCRPSNRRMFPILLH